MATDVNTMTFGVEIECLIPVAALDARAWRIGAYHVGAAIPGHPGWKAMRDASIGSRDYNMAGVEVVSPVLSGPDGLASVRAMCEALREMGAKVNVSTGFHVHVGWTGRAAQLRRLICLVSHHEQALYAATGTHSREGNHFCHSIKVTHSALARMRSMEDVARAHMSRYHVLNLANLLSRSRDKSTVEFRVFAGTTNFLKIATYVQIALGLVQKSLDSSAVAPWDATAVAKAEREGLGQGMWAVRQLLGRLRWYEQGDYAPYGVLDRSMVPAMRAELKRLATKYDGNTNEVDA